MLYKYFFGLLLLFLLLIAVLMVLPVPQNVTGTIHPTFSTMMHGGDSIVQMPMNKWLALLLGLSVVGIFGFCILISVTKHSNSSRPAVFRMVLGTLLYLMVLVVLFGLHYHTMNDPALQLFGGFPHDTAWMLFVLSLIPIYFSYYYVKKFHDLILTDDDLQRFEELVLKRNSLTSIH